ncbi:uncharacterized protein LOC100897840 [Galendromus occidentalis]|uniref:Uncharacterized protein LOC100897840 n=1 Tax=Galendromus occidentalis TaxID=34638 RepID=A0AAJ6QUJ6_9ACAR|nr:uncharacterized protein LOC100897840 [Galendromus occidentalis]
MSMGANGSKEYRDRGSSGHEDIPRSTMISEGKYGAQPKNKTAIHNASHTNPARASSASTKFAVGPGNGWQNIPPNQPLYPSLAQAAPGRNVYQAPQQKSQLQPQQLAPKKPKPNKQAVEAVVQSLKEVVESNDGFKFNLENIDTLYAIVRGERIPYAALGFANLSSFIESKCDFLSIVRSDGHTQIVLRPPTYQDAVHAPMGQSQSTAVPRKETNVTDLVHDELTAIDLERLKMISDSKAKNGLSIQQFEEEYLLAFFRRIDFKGFSRTAFFRGLSDIVEMREEEDGIKLYAKTQKIRSAASPQQHKTMQTGNAGGKSSLQTNPKKKNAQPAGGQKPSLESNSKTPQKQQRGRGVKPNQLQHQVCQQKGLAGGQEFARQRQTNPELKLSQSFENEIRRTLQDCKRPGGLTPDEFKRFFEGNSKLKFDTLGFSDEAFFKGLPHLFQVIDSDFGIRIMPAPLRTGLARSNFNNFKSTSALSGTQSRPEINNISASTGNLTISPSSCMMHMVGEHCLWIISINNYEYVPTGCVARLANLPKDTVLSDLRKHNMDIRYIRKLDDESIKKVLVNNSVAQADEEVMTIPLKSVPLILRVFLGKNVDEVFMENLSKVSVEHIRNKRAGRYNR